MLKRSLWKTRHLTRSHQISPVWFQERRQQAGRIRSILCILRYENLINLMILIPRSEHFLALSCAFLSQSSCFQCPYFFPYFFPSPSFRTRHTHSCAWWTCCFRNSFFRSNSDLPCRYASSSSSPSLRFSPVIRQVKCCRWARTMLSHGNWQGLLGRFWANFELFRTSTWTSSKPK